MENGRPSVSSMHSSSVTLRVLRGTAAGLCFAAAAAMMSAVILRERGSSDRDRRTAGDSNLPRQQPLEACCELARTEPRHFPRGTHMPPFREDAISGVFNPSLFSPERDLVRIEDKSVWWESDAGAASQPEDDHLVHRAVEAPFVRLSALVRRSGGRLEVRDAYRPDGIHVPKSLHREGRALDLTSTDITLERLAALCWVAGFDWVYYESRPEHVHCSVRVPRNGPAGTSSIPRAATLPDTPVPPENLPPAEDDGIDSRPGNPLPFAPVDCKSMSGGHPRSASP